MSARWGEVWWLTPPLPRGLARKEPIGHFFAGAAALVAAGLLITTGFTPASWNISTSRFAMYLSSPSFSSQVENPKLFGGALPRPPRPPPAAPASLGAPPPPAESWGPLQFGSERPDMPPAPIPRPGGEPIATGLVSPSFRMISCP